MKYEIKFTTQFKRDLKLAQKQHRDTSSLFAVIEKLANGESLDRKFRDHDLSGNYKGCRECHIEPDWLLIYEYVDDVLVLIAYFAKSACPFRRNGMRFRFKRQGCRLTVLLSHVTAIALKPVGLLSHSA